MPRRKAITWKKVLGLLLAVVGTSAVFGGYSIYRMVAVVVPHSYAAWMTGDLLVEFMETHNDHWPRGWEDLAKARDSLVQKGRNIYYDFDKLPIIVKIDWNAEPAALTKAALAGESELRVVTQLDGSRLESKWGSDTEPNRKVGRYLIQRRARLTAEPSPTATAPNKTSTEK